MMGTNAAKMAFGLGARFKIINRSLRRLRQLEDLFGGQAQTLFASSTSIADHFAEAEFWSDPSFARSEGAEAWSW